MSMTAAQLKAGYKYDRENTKQFRLKLNTKTDMDIIKRMESVPNKQGYIKQLIRADLEKGKETEKQ